MKTVMPPVVAADKPLLMVGCGILHKEGDYLIKKNGSNVETQFLHSSLHNYFDKLYKKLDGALDFDDQKRRRTVVFYGACHPKIGDILDKHHTLRTEGQNCIVMRLGYEKFMAELEQGSYFLVEDWALTWDPMVTAVFGKNLTVIREIFHSNHKKMIALRTPCSTDFTAAAEAAARFIDLPLECMDVDLDHLEKVLADAIAAREHAEK